MNKKSNQSSEDEVEFIAHLFFRLCLVALGLTLLFFCFVGCKTLSPAEWTADEQMRAARSCAVTCYPNPIQRYEALTGTCSCFIAPPFKSGFIPLEVKP